MGRFKNLKRSRRDDDEDEDVASDEEIKSSKKSTKKSNKKAKTSGDSGKDDEGNSFWSLGGTRRVTISDFKGKTYINIREYYTDASGSLKPGKKGIMISLEQYDKLVEAIPSINAELRAKGHETPALSSAPAADKPEESAKTKPEKTKPEKAAKSKKKAKANIEATSDEDEEEEEDEDEDEEEDEETD
ncbi:PC4-domain-containing protein [Annulohypoxylon maeteangense]|uniref:PC4-domain-containing protein n=1 Tax=Annulohypoxylon maeteangense TaxID=1927788 RepID=UPI002007357E|nr:PC4-domain-containing protein [Annulohypoxylon maeteangense]KAI0885665.1 PC4-domain-containing protein [Annulohypoxylon maeteangense]